MKQQQIKDESKEVKEGGEFTGGDWIACNDGRTVTAEFETGYTIVCQVENPEDSQLLAQSKNMYYTLKAIVDNWDKRMSGDREVYKEGVIKDAPAYWSPSASMVSSEYIAQARDILNKATPKK